MLTDSDLLELLETPFMRIELSATEISDILFSLVEEDFPVETDSLFERVLPC